MIPNADEVRRSRVQDARSRISAVRASHGDRPLVISSVGAVAWATGGLSIPIDRAAVIDPVWLVAREGATTLVVNSVEVERLSREYDLDDLGFTLVAAPWYEPRGHADAVERLVGAPLAECLTDSDEGIDVSDDLVRARLSLGAAEVTIVSELGRRAATAVEAAARAWHPGVSTDYDVAAAVQGGLESSGADAVCLIVGGDDRVRSFRHPLAVGEVVEDLLMVVVVARFQGLHVALTRMAATRVDPVLEADLAKCDEVAAAVGAALHVGSTWRDVYAALGDGYRRVGAPQAWREHYQGGPIGYAQREFELAPGAESSPWWSAPVGDSTAVAFNPSLAGGAKIEDTYLVVDGAPKRVTEGEWPRGDGPWAGAGVWLR